MVFVSGFLLGISIIIAIGAQNIFLIKQGVKREYPYYCAFICFFCDMAMIFASVFGLHQFLLRFPNMQTGLLIAAIIFLLVYAAFCFRNAYQNRNNKNGKLVHFNSIEQVKTLFNLLLLSLGFSLVNPQAILDCMIIIGGYAQRYPSAKLAFSLGVLSASFVWFMTLTTVAIWAGEFLKKAIVWYYLEMVSGLLMLWIALQCAASLALPLS